ncbi:uncharacterized protein LOC114532426 [Dendronephthya gigantea]|uniref:uncharacterized protein LOC114532426 n=1 Tax=Dendronephthya gigantea TaxID=151771 RepID=UPI00106A7266|nr:uncharacterized protein LOC114532426 [Dendronephthya gigantea]
MECYEATENEIGWNHVGNVKGVDILKRPASADFSIWDCSKGTIEINVPLNYLLSYLDDMTRTSDYDDMFDTGQVVETLGDLTKVVYMEYKGIWPVSGRDFCSVSAIRVLEDNTVVFFAKHAKHPSCPPCKKYVRGKILTGGYVMKVLSDNPPRILSTYITHVDLQGSVPSRIVNKITANQPASIGIVKKVVEEMYNEERANPDRPPSKFQIAALDFALKLERAREVVAASRPPPKATGDTPIVPSQFAPELQALNEDSPGSPDDQQPNKNLSPTHSSSSPSIHAVPFEFNGLDFKTIGNHASAGLIQEAFEVSDVEITKVPGPSVHEQWEYQETEKKVMIFRKTHRNEKMHSFIGKGIIASPPPKIWEILKDPESTYKYNSMLKETRTLERLNDTQRIEYLHFETEKCFKKEARDFIVLRTERQEKDKYLLSFVSVDYPNSPSKKDVKRGKIIASGWVVEPLLHNGQLQSMVTYLAQVNPGGNYPAMLVNITGRKQPLCLAYLRRLLENPNQTLNRSQSIHESDRF